MGAALGIGAAGIESGGPVAAAQAAAMSGGSVAMAVAPVLIPETLCMVVVGAVLGIGAAKVIESKTFPFEPNGLGKRFAVAAHDWGVVRFWSFDDKGEARGLFRQLTLRRILVDMHTSSVVYDVKRSWTELRHAGAAPWTDNEIRAALALQNGRSSSKMRPCA
jgi:hypothetical protein